PLALSGLISALLRQALTLQQWPLSLASPILCTHAAHSVSAWSSHGLLPIVRLVSPDSGSASLGVSAHPVAVVPMRAVREKTNDPRRRCMFMVRLRLCSVRAAPSASIRRPANDKAPRMGREDAQPSG